MREKRLIVGGDPDERYPVPVEGAFQGDFLPAPELEQVAHALIRKHEMLDGGLGEENLTVLWKRKGGSSGGVPTLGKCAKLSGLARFFGHVEFVIWVAADHARAEGLTRWQVEALVYHELLHAELDDEKGWTRRGHDVEVFAAELAEYGAWRRDLSMFMEVARQMPLFETVPA
ncbi:MAG TPA: putative metallopeptidase [Chloroflexota bacterium]|nr:putative metallopeptidase [Chloroflexota bacterium]